MIPGHAKLSPGFLGWHTPPVQTLRRFFLTPHYAWQVKHLFLDEPTLPPPTHNTYMTGFLTLWNGIPSEWHGLASNLHMLYFGVCTYSAFASLEIDFLSIHPGFVWWCPHHKADPYTNLDQLIMQHWFSWTHRPSLSSDRRCRPWPLPKYSEPSKGLRYIVCWRRL